MAKLDTRPEMNDRLGEGPPVVVEVVEPPSLSRRLLDVRTIFLERRLADRGGGR